MIFHPTHTSHTHQAARLVVEGNAGSIGIVGAAAGRRVEEEGTGVEMQPLMPTDTQSPKP